MTVRAHDGIMLFENRCAGCDAPGLAICRTCRFALVGPPPQGQAHGIIAAVPFTGRAREVVLSLRNRKRRQVARHLGGLLANRLVEAEVHRDLDVVTWAPTGPRWCRQRRFDPVEEIAHTVGRQLGVPTRCLLARPGLSTAQKERSRSEHSGVPEFAAKAGLSDCNVVVVDDVATTGATLLAASDALEQQGAHHVTLAAVASTPAASGAKVLSFHRAPRAVAA